MAIDPRIAEESVTLKASAQAVFAALTQPEHVLQWWGNDELYRSTRLEIDLVPGGRANHGGRFHAGRDFLSVGTVRMVDAPYVLEHTRTYQGGIPCAEETVIRYELEEHNGRTLLRVTHSGFESEEMCSMHSDGWVRVFNWLRTYVNSGALEAVHA